MRLSFVLAALCAAVSTAPAVAGTLPQYTILDLGTVGSDSASQAFGISAGGVAAGRSVGSTTTAYSWSLAGGFTALPKLTGRNFAVGNDANDSGLVVGTATTTAFGAGAVPVMWTNGVVAQLPMPAGETVGRANSINAAGVAVGSVGSGISERAVIYSNGGVTVIPLAAGGGKMTTAYGITDSGLVFGIGTDASNAARNVGMVYTPASGVVSDIGAIPGANGAIAFAASPNGYVVGSSMTNQGSGLPFIRDLAGNMIAIPVLQNASSGSARGVNSAGWAVGNFGTAFSLPFLYDGSQTHLLADLLPAGSGWDFLTNTSASAMGISDNGIIVGTAVHNGLTHAYALVPVPEPGTLAMLLAGVAVLGLRARRGLPRR